MNPKKQFPERVRLPKQKRSKTKVKVILFAAKKCFAKFGYAKTTMTRIAEEAKVSTGTTYSYFADKDDVLKKILEEHVENILYPAEEIMNSLTKKSTLRATLKNLIRTALDFHEEVELHRVFHERIMKDPNFHAMAAGYRDRGLEICRKLVEKFGGSKAKKELEASAQVLVGLLDFCTHVNTLYPSKITQEEACKVGIEMIIAYFK